MKTGIDISSHQGAVNWGKVVADFAILRAGWSWYDGGMNIDKRFLQNVAGAREVGVPWGAYLYAYDRTPAAARVSAERLADLLDQFQLPYPVAYDFEDTQYLGTGRESNTAICKAFLETLQGRGYYVMLYTYTNFAKGYLDMARLAAYDLWIADYTGQVGWPGEYGIWQYSGSGRAPGVTGQVDLDRAYRDYPAIIRAAGLNGYGRRPLPPDCAALRQENQTLRDRLAAQEKQLDSAQGRLAEIRRIAEG